MQILYLCCFIIFFVPRSRLKKLWIILDVAWNPFVMDEIYPIIQSNIPCHLFSNESIKCRWWSVSHHFHLVMWTSLGFQLWTVMCISFHALYALGEKNWGPHKLMVPPIQQKKCRKNNPIWAFPSLNILKSLNVWWFVPIELGIPGIWLRYGG